MAAQPAAASSDAASTTGNYDAGNKRDVDQREKTARNRRERLREAVRPLGNRRVHAAQVHSPMTDR